MSKKPAENNGGNKITNYFDIKNIVPKKNNGSNNEGWEKKNKKKETRDFHQSSREASVHSDHTEIIVSSENEHVEDKICCQMILIGPCDVSYFESVRKKIIKVCDSYSKAEFINFVLDNAKMAGHPNVDILQKIDDEDFWIKTAPVLLQYAQDVKKQKMISSCVHMLIQGSSRMVTLTKAQVLMILINMFLCTLPRQTHRDHLSFSYLMHTREKQSEATISIRRQKLKCIMNYFKILLRRKFVDLERENIDYSRASRNYDIAQIQSVGYSMAKVEIGFGKIQQRYQYDIMIDFANKSIGGGALRNGAVQEEILFMVFPELIASICICFQLEDNEAIIVLGAQKFNNYAGYSQTFEFTGTFQQETEGPFKSVIVAIDALDFKTFLHKTDTQFIPAQIDRQILKALVGIEGADVGADPQMRVCTGRWGCGAFGGDIYLKFIIQWLACSIAGKEMLYMAQEQEEAKELKVLSKFLSAHYQTIEILELIYEYHSILKSKSKMSFLQFLKMHA